MLCNMDWKLKIICSFIINTITRKIWFTNNNQNIFEYHLFYIK